MSIFSKLSSNFFLKVFSYNSIIVLGKVLSSFIVSKVSAIYLGPSGYAIVGNFKNVLQGVLGLSTSGFESGVIKYFAENKNNPDRFKKIIASVVVLNVLISFVISLFLLVFSDWLSIYALKDESLAYIFKYLAVFLPLISLNFLVIYMVNGLQEFKLYTILVTVSNVLNAFLTFIFIYNFGLKGALIVGVLVPALSFLGSLFFRHVRYLISTAITNIKNVSRNFLKSISSYIVMAIYSSVLISLTYLLIRNKIIEDFDMTTAGFWEAMNKISAFYMMFFSSLFTLYLLPKLSINNTVSGYNKIMKTYFKFLVPIVIFVFIGLFVFRALVIEIFLTDAFKSIEQFFYLQLIGDFVKVIAFSIAYQFHAKKMFTFYFISDFILYTSFYLIGIYFMNFYGFHGIFYAYIISVCLYLVLVSIFLTRNNTNYLGQNVY